MTGIYKLYWDCGYIYVGQADNIDRRIKNHIYQLKRNMHRNVKLQRVSNKHGLPKWEVLELCSIADLTPTEQKYIDKYMVNNYCCNISPTAGSCLGIKKSDEYKQRCRERMLHEFNPTKGVGHTEEAKKKMSKSHTGKKLTPIHAERIHSQIRGGGHGRARRVLDTATGNIYDCILNASKAAGMNYGTFKNQINGSKRNKTTFVMMAA